jgi:cobalt-zinc-cadmium efflux system protein
VPNQEHTPEVRGNRLLIATILNLVISVAEIIGGILSNSLSLLSDALHNLSDALATFIAWVADRVSRRPSNARRTFGYKRVQILAAFFNAQVLIVISFYLFYEAAQRLLSPEPVKGSLMLVVASIGFVANLIAVILLHSGSKDNINIKAAYLHMLGDTLTSVAVIIGGILIMYFEVFWIDPLVTIIIGLYILKETWGIFKQSVDILMQGTPPGLNLEQIQKDMEKIPGIANIHHVHSWNLDDQSIHFECHIKLKEDLPLSGTSKIHSEIVSLLKEKHDIGHVTVQFEYQSCSDQTLIAGN